MMGSFSNLWSQSKSNRNLGIEIGLNILKAIVLFGVAAVYFWSLWQRSVQIEGVRYFFAMDDVHVSMRYADNLLRGNGLVWNAGEYVEGFTNLGWTLFLGLNPLLGLPASKAAILPIFANVILLLTGIVMMVNVSNRLFGGSGFVVLVISSMVVLGRSVAFSASWGFESVVQAFGVLLLGLPLVCAPFSGRLQEYSKRQQWCMAIVAALLIIVRIDSIVVISGLAVSAIIMSRRKRLVELRKLAVWQLGGASASLVLVVVLQRGYYGEWLPNTFFLKTDPSLENMWFGLDQFVHHYNHDGGWTIWAAVLGVVLFNRQRLIDLLILLFPWLFLAVYSGYTSGDYFALDFANRFLTVGDLYFCAIACVLLSEILVNEGGRRVSVHSSALAAIKLAFILAVMLIAFDRSVDLPRIWLSPEQRNIYERYIRTAIFLNRDPKIPDGSHIALFPAGLIPHFVDRLNFVDMLGKCDAHVARLESRPGLPIGHNKYSFDHSIDVRRPDIILTEWNDGATDEQLKIEAGKSPYRFFLDIFLHGSLQRDYELDQSGPYSRGENGTLAVWRRRSNLQP
jgi:hypothetical protein